MKEFRAKLLSRSGIGLVFVPLIVSILVVCASIVILGYRQHLKNSRLIFDELTVSTAERIAKETFILDIRTDGVTYYYDGIRREVIDASTFEGKVDLDGYGRSSQAENAKGETGAVGIPNKGGEDGAQILAVSVESDGTVHSRWQGFWLTGEDYELMTQAERDRLTIDQLNQIDSSLIYEPGKTDLMTETESDAGGNMQMTEQETDAGESEQRTEPETGA